MISTVISLGVPVFFILVLGLFVGRTIEVRHFRSLAIRESQLQGILITQSKEYIEPTSQVAPTMFTSEAVIATDPLKNFLSSWRNFFGGEMRSYVKLIERARREALLRLVEQARGMGYNAICNLRMQTADIGGNLGKRGMPMGAIMASATGYHSALAGK